MKFVKLFCMFLTAAVISACGGSSDNVTTPTSAAASGPAAGVSVTLDQVAGTNGFNALLAAAAKADLGGALADPDASLTVFAPTDDAFSRLAASLGFASAAAMVDALPASSLKSILSYHVLPARKAAAELRVTAQSAQPTLYAFEGKPSALTIDSGSSGITVTDAALTTANVTTADVSASNGVIHVIDKVLVPPGVLTIMQTAQVNPQLSSLVNAVVSANLQETLSGAGPFTVFAPTNAAFSQAPTGLTQQQLATVLTYHALDKPVLASQIPFGVPIQTLAAQPIVIHAGTPPTIRDTTATPARIVATDVRASNGVVHVIDKVLIPAL